MKAVIAVALCVACSTVGAQTKSQTKQPDQAACRAYEGLLESALMDLALKGLNTSARSAVQATQLELEKLNVRQTMSLHLQHMAYLGCPPPSQALDESQYFAAALNCVAASSESERKRQCDQSAWKRGMKDLAPK